MTSDAPLILGSPLEGWCAGLEDCPDAVFRDRLLGDGVSIDPVSGALRAPFDGTVLTLPASQHAVNLRADNGAEILIHVGIDTVGLSGEGFDALVAPGDRVKRGQLLLRFDLAVLASRAASCRTPVLLLRQEGYRLERLAAEGPIAFGEPLLAIHAPQRQVGASVEPAHDDSAFAPLSTTLRTGLAHGIHARPAAGLGAALKDLDVDAALVTAAGARADVRSPVALMGLGIGHGDVVHLEAQGPEAERAIGLLLPQLEPLPDAVGDAVQACNERPATEQEPQLAPSPPKPGERRAAQAAAPGLALGPVWQWRPWVPPQDIAVASPALELQALDEALAQVRGHLAHIARKEVGEGAAVATAHLALLDDPSLVQRARTLIGDGQGASAAWGAALEEAAAPLATLHDPRMQERCDDLEDLSRQVQRVLAGEAPDATLALPADTIVIAENLLPSQLMALAAGKPAGICLAGGGATSHVAILAAAENIPMLVATGPAVLAIADGEDLCLDAQDGALWRPLDASARAAFKKRIADDKAEQQAAAEHAHEPAVTRDGIRIPVLANLASVDEAEAAVRAGAEGCGLLRSEFLFMARSVAPTANEQRQELQTIADALGDRPLVVRSLDAGADKPLDFLNQAPEDNPALGERGIRLSLTQPELLDEQLLALLQVTRERPLELMLPMVSRVDEVLQVKERLAALRTEQGIDQPLSLGIMIETPAAALRAERLARHVDFFSIGTNDLTQYTLCMDRLEPSLAALLDPLDPAVLELIAATARAGSEAGIEVSVCGAAAADRLAVPLLIGFGINKLSVPANAIGRLKARLRGLDQAACAALAQEVLGLDSAGAVRHRVREHLEET